MRLGLIYARSRNGVIGKDGKLPWHLPEDLAHFKQVTLGCPVVMGRKTWDSLPPKFRPLPGRRNIVITQQPDWAAEGAERAASLDEALHLCTGEPQAWVIGGAQIYRQALRHADRVEVTLVGLDVDGDAFAPELGAGWIVQSRESRVTAGGVGLDFITYVPASA